MRGTVRPRKKGPPPRGDGPCSALWWLLGAVAVLGHVELGELVGEPGVGAAGPDLLERREVLVEGRAEAAEAVAVAEAELGGDLVGVQQADLVHRARQRLGRLDLDPPVALEPRRSRDQLADDHVLLQAVEGVLLALERRVRE